MPFGCSFILHLIQSNCERQPKDEVIFPLSQHRLSVSLLGIQLSVFMSACSYTGVNKTWNFCLWKQICRFVPICHLILNITFFSHFLSVEFYKQRHLCGKYNFLQLGVYRCLQFGLFYWEKNNKSTCRVASRGFRKIKAFRTTSKEKKYSLQLDWHS